MVAKEIHDATIEEIAELADAADELLAAAMFLVWRGEHENDEDQSAVESISRMVKALTAVGLPQQSLTQFIADMEAMLKSGLSPDEWFKLRRASVLSCKFV